MKKHSLRQSCKNQLTGIKFLSDSDSGPLSKHIVKPKVMHVAPANAMANATPILTSTEKTVEIF